MGIRDVWHRTSFSRIPGMAGRLIADALWPRTCFICEGEDNVGAGDVCEACWSRLMSAKQLECPRHLEHLYIAFAYDDFMRSLVHRFKFSGIHELAEPLGEHMCDQLEFMDVRIGGGIVVPVPSHPTRRRERGYNPAEELARVVAWNWKLKIRPELATRVLYSPPQSTLSDAERKRALVGAFRFAEADEEQQQRIILVDDVVHTGTTLNRLAEAAHEAGWQQVEAICLCT